MATGDVTSLAADAALLLATGDVATRSLAAAAALLLATSEVIPLDEDAALLLATGDVATLSFAAAGAAAGHRRSHATRRGRRGVAGHR